MPALVLSENSERDSMVRSWPPGRWLDAISFTVLGARMRAPSSSPPLVSMVANRM